MPYWGYYRPYVAAASKKAKAEAKIKSLRKKNPNLKPVLIQGNTLAGTWWGKSWNTNLESYADYHNRIGRGRSYVRNRAVLDLQVQPGLIKSLVQGTRSSPYEIEIKIKPLNKTIWKNVKNVCNGAIESLQELLSGKFPESLLEVFTNKKSGLFPSPKEISFDCSCPDWASMCKHIAATLYGVGARLDLEPALFFTLRKVKMNDLITGVIEEKTTSLLKKAKQKSSRVLDDSDLSSLFGIEMEESDKKPGKKAKVVKAKTVKAKSRPVKVKTRKKQVKKKIIKKKFVKKVSKTTKKKSTKKKRNSPATRTLRHKGK